MDAEIGEVLRDKDKKGQKDEQRSAKTLLRKLKIEEHEPHLKPRVSSGAPEG